MTAENTRTDEDALRDLQERFTAFTNACAHDLRSPARNIAALCELLSESESTRHLTEKDTALLDAVASESKRLTAVLDAVVAYARVPVRAERDTVDLASMLRAQWTSHAEDLTVDALPLVTGEPELLASLIGHLLANVVRFAGEGSPRLHVFAQRSEDGVEIHFADQGIGVPAGREQVVFSVLRRCHTVGGVGAGLAICERIVAAHGGSIRVVAGRTDGATIVVSLPDV